MTALQTRLRQFGGELGALCQKVYHYRKPPRKEAPYITWAEDGEGDGTFNADSRKAEQNIHGYIDYFTLTEYDTAVDDIQALLDSHGSEWTLNDVQYEPETNLIHYSWEFNI